MIASVHGKITYLTPKLRKDCYAVIEAAGVGYKVSVTASDIGRLQEGQEVTLLTYLSVSERALDLYGFTEPSSKTFFTLLLTVPGIGPKSAMGILDKTSMAEVQTAVLADDPNELVKMSGLTLKTAEKIVLALKDKVDSLTSKHEARSTKHETDTDAFEVLLSFGYSNAEAKAALAKVDSAVINPSERVRAALKMLGSRK